MSRYLSISTPFLETLAGFNLANKLASFVDGEYIQADEGLLRQGYGTHTTVDGLSYYGNWSGDKMNGQGEFWRSEDLILYSKIIRCFLWSC